MRKILPDFLTKSEEKQVEKQIRYRKVKRKLEKIAIQPNFVRTSEVRKMKEKMRKCYVTKKMESQQKN